MTMSKSITEKTGDPKRTSVRFFVASSLPKHPATRAYFAYLFSLDKFLFFSSLQWLVR